MSELQKKVQREVEFIHEFFEAWFTGTARVEDLESVFIPRMSKDMLFIDPDGNQIGGPGLTEGIRQGYASNSDFRLRVRDVKILYETSDHLLVHYTEWQTGSKGTARVQSGRVSTALLTNADPFLWLHLQETWLPEATQSAGDYSFAKK